MIELIKWRGINITHRSRCPLLLKTRETSGMKRERNERTSDKISRTLLTTQQPSPHHFADSRELFLLPKRSTNEKPPQLATPIGIPTYIDGDVRAHDKNEEN